jgi:histone deacetylase HOS3
MSRHGRKVPVSFYRRFAEDARQFAEKYARGKLISVLEGGYSDRALTSGAMAHLIGLVNTEDFISRDARGIDEAWWAIDNLVKVIALTILIASLEPKLMARPARESG